MAPSRISPEPVSAPVPTKTVAGTAAPNPPATPTVDSFDATAEPGEVVASLIRNGGCFVRNLVSASDLAIIEKDVRPFLIADKEWDGDFFPKETRRAMGLPGKSTIYTEKVPMNALYREVCKQLLTTKSKSWLGNQLTENVSHPQLNATAVISIAPGSKRQELHRDDIIHHNSVLAITADQYTIGRDTAVGLFVAGKKATKRNGATRFVPGSHLQASEQQPDESGVVYAEMEAGDAFIMLASAYHGGSANETEDEERLLYTCFTTRGYLRQEENQYLANPIEKVKAYPRDIQELLGYSVSQPLLGWVDLQDPIALLLSEDGTDGKNLW